MRRQVRPGHRGAGQEVREPRTRAESRWDDPGVAGVITASETSWIVPFTGLSPLAFRKLVTTVRRDAAGGSRPGVHGRCLWRTGSS